MAIPSSLPVESPRRVLIVVEDQMLSEVLAESLTGAGHMTVQVEGSGEAERALSVEPFDAAIVDLDTRARDGLALVAHIRAVWPSLTVIALLPCGGLPEDVSQPPFHLAIEKPARLAAVLCAVNVAHAAARN